MAPVRLTKRIEFAASHRYHNDSWDSARNQAVFGACHTGPGHGHNYLLEVTVGGEIDACTGMVVNLYDLKQVLKQVLEEFDHKHLNLDTPYFKDAIPTTENVAQVLWRLLAARPGIGKLEKVRLFEDEGLCADVAAEANGRASLTRRYHFSAAHRLDRQPLSVSAKGRESRSASDSAVAGHNYVLHVTVQGEIHPDTGMVTDITALDRLVQEQVLQRFDHRDLGLDPELSVNGLTGEQFARFIWGLLVKEIPGGRLVCVGLAETQESFYEYAE